jgi:hypothetical protein
MHALNEMKQDHIPQFDHVQNFTMDYTVDSRSDP